VDSGKSSEALISILRNTSFLLEHYGYGGHDPSLSELQRTLLRAISNLQPTAPPGDFAANRSNGYSPKK